MILLFYKFTEMVTANEGRKQDQNLKTKTKLTKPRPRPPEVNKGTWRILLWSKWTPLLISTVVMFQAQNRETINSTWKVCVLQIHYDDERNKIVFHNTTPDLQV